MFLSVESFINIRTCVAVGCCTYAQEVNTILNLCMTFIRCIGCLERKKNNFKNGGEVIRLKECALAFTKDNDSIYITRSGVKGQGNTG